MFNVAQNTLSDIRDNKSYTVRKLADGKCWMVQNLRLVGPFQPDESDSDVTWTKSSTSFNLPTDNRCVEYYSACLVDRGDTYGASYNWYSATAGTGFSAAGGGDASASICPKGWRLPSQTILQGLTSVYPTTLLDTNGPSLVTPGYWDSSGVVNDGTVGYLWSSTRSSGNYAYDLTFFGTRFGHNNDPTHVGFQIRCVAR